MVTRRDTRTSPIERSSSIIIGGNLTYQPSIPGSLLDVRSQVHDTKPLSRRSQLLLGVFLATSLASACERRDTPIENVLLISIDTLRADHLGTYGYVRDTSPHVDALAASSWVFEAAYAPVPRTGPSVAALQTGSFPDDLTRWGIPEQMNTLAEILVGRGWTTVAAVDNANLSKQAGYSQGFDVYRETWEESDSEIERTHLITDTALTHLQQFGETDEPFFMWLHYVNPHRPYTPPTEYQPRFIDDSYFDASVRLPHTGGHVGGIRTGVYVEGEHRLAYYVAQYDSETRFADDQIGAVLGALRAQSALANTLVVLTADHGEGLGEQDVYFKHGPYVLESHVRVPLIIHHPTRTSSPRRVQRPVGIIDVVPTVLDMAGISEPTFQGPRLEHPLAGQSLASVRDGELDGHRQDIFFASRNYWGIRSGDWKLILETREAKGNVGSSHQLFNLREDPEENVNVYDATDDQSARVLRRLEARRQIQTFAGSDEDWDARSKELSEEALENLRALGYIR